MARTMEELKTLIAQMLREMAPGTEPAVKASEYKPTVPGPQEPPDAGEILEDIADIDLRRQYLVEAPADREGYLRLKSKTPARLGVGRAGPRYKTITLLVSGGPCRRPGQRLFPGAGGILQIRWPHLCQDGM